MQPTERSSVALLLPYYGKWPSYFPFFLQSCKWNPHIDFWLITDLQVPDAPPNVKVLALSFSELRQHFTEKLGFEIDLMEPYKLCDLKPTYGKVFEDHLEHYHWWGFGDVDIVLSDLRGFVTSDDWAAYDVISFRDKWLSGSCCFFRNTPQLVNLYQEIANYQQLMTTSQHLALDELSNCFAQVKERDSIFDVVFPYENLTLAVRRAEKDGRIRCRFQTQINEYIHPHEYIHVANGTVTRSDGRMYAYHHLLNEKKQWYFDAPTEAIGDEFYITCAGVVSKTNFESNHLPRLIRQRKMAMWPFWVRMQNQRVRRVLKRWMSR